MANEGRFTKQQPRKLIQRSMDIGQTIDSVAFCLGCLSVWIATRTLFKFARIKLKLSRAIAWMISGELIMACATTTFAFGQLTGKLIDVPENYQSLLRMVMFASAAFTTLHLSKTYDDIAAGKNE